MEHTLAELLQRFTYPAILLLLSAAGLGVPISEDLVLLVAGAALLGVGVWWFLRKRRRRREAAGREPAARSLARRDVRESSGTTPV